MIEVVVSSPRASMRNECPSGIAAYESRAPDGSSGIVVRNNGFTLPEDGTWLIVTTVIADPDYLTQEFVLSSQFKKGTDLSKWNPRPCDIPAPVVRRGHLRNEWLIR